MNLPEERQVKTNKKKEGREGGWEERERNKEKGKRTRKNNAHCYKHGDKLFAVIPIKKWSSFPHLLNLSKKKKNLSCPCDLLCSKGCSMNGTVQFLNLGLQRTSTLTLLKPSYRARMPRESAGEAIAPWITALAQC